MDLDGVQPLPHPSRQEQVELAGEPFLLWRPPSPEQLLDALVEAPPDPDDKLPYWADLWPSALGLAERLLETSLNGRDVLELGCGLGLSSLAAARRGASVTATDWDEDALRYVEASATLNGLSIQTRRLDWRSPGPVSAEILIGADLLYEARNVPWLVELFEAWTGRWALIADPGRKPAVEFKERLSRSFDLSTRKVWVENPLVPRGRVDVDLIEISRTEKTTRK